MMMMMMNHVKILEARKVIQSKCPTEEKYRLHHINISRPGYLALRICALLVSTMCLHCFMDTILFIATQKLYLTIQCVRVLRVRLVPTH